MPKFAAFLRAVNLGPTRKISSADLRSLFEELGFEDVATFRTSGNVVFEAGREPAAGQIERALGEALGGEVPVFLRTAKEIRALADHEPFPSKVVDASKGKLQVVLLAEASRLQTCSPSPRTRIALLSARASSTGYRMAASATPGSTSGRSRSCSAPRPLVRRARSTSWRQSTSA